MEGEGGDESECEKHGRSGRKGSEGGLHDFIDCATRISAPLGDLAGLRLGNAVDATDATPRDGGEVERGVTGDRGGAEQELAVVKLAESGPEQAQSEGRASATG